MPRGRRSGGGMFGGSKRSGGGFFGSSKKSGGLFSRKKTTKAPAKRAAPAPTPVTRAAPPSTGGGMLSGIGSTIVQGMAFGTGSAIAHRAVGAVANGMSGSDEPRSAGAESGAASYPDDTKVAPPAMDCSGFMAALNTCLQKHPGDIGMCQQPMDMLRDCKFQAEAGMSTMTPN